MVPKWFPNLWVAERQPQRIGSPDALPQEGSKGLLFSSLVCAFRSAPVLGRSKLCRHGITGFSRAVSQFGSCCARGRAHSVHGSLQAHFAEETRCRSGNQSLVTSAATMGRMFQRLL